MKKLVAVMFVLSLIASVAFAQVDEATDTLTNDEAQGRLRVSNCVFGGPNVDVLVNGDVAVNGGVPQTDQSFGVTGYLYLTPGTYSVAAVPTGKGVEEALTDPVDVSVEAGHRYTVTVLGQGDEPSHEALVIDETEAYLKAGTSPDTGGHITVNNIKGAPGLNFLQDGVGERNVPYGGFAATAPPVMEFEEFQISVGGSGTPTTVVEDNGAGFTMSGADSLDCFGGTYPGTMLEDFDTRTSASTSDLNSVDYLRSLSTAHDKLGGLGPSFNTFLTAVETAGLTNLLITESPYMLFAPTDEAFAALPTEELDALMADPEALANFLQAHIASGYYPPGSLGHDLIDRTVTNLLGAELVLTGGGGEDLAINGVAMGPGGDYTIAANGSRVFLVTNLLPPSD